MTVRVAGLIMWNLTSATGCILGGEKGFLFRWSASGWFAHIQCFELLLSYFWTSTKKLSKFLFYHPPFWHLWSDLLSSISMSCFVGFLALASSSAQVLLPLACEQLAVGRHGVLVVCSTLGERHVLYWDI